MTDRRTEWEVLGIEPTSDQRAIRSAYAQQLKVIDPEQEPLAFIALRAALESAMSSQSMAESTASPRDSETLNDGRPVPEAISSVVEGDAQLGDADRAAQNIMSFLYSLRAPR